VRWRKSSQIGIVRQTYADAQQPGGIFRRASGTRFHHSRADPALETPGYSQGPSGTLALGIEVGGLHNVVFRCVGWLIVFCTKGGGPMLPNNPAIRRIQRMMKRMPYISEHLSSLRQEITALRNSNALVTKDGRHNEHDQTALELRTKRLREIKEELSRMLSQPDDPKVWWERLRRRDIA
jgi:hypothetical protein